ncbi:hypothetical protein HU200_001567 [Digitaria exilis]|uniref:tyrosine--tRNA ligase n=1 Tax=Digitaria exilis TaxID=1010633 RepID=A0A835KUQ5_9POAL|nr:hypothetical protein HU200_001567 [Digitaria exilis]
MAPAGSIGAGTEAAPAGSPMPGIGAAPAPAVSEVPATATGAASAAAQSLEERFSILLSIAEECVEEDESAQSAAGQPQSSLLRRLRTLRPYAHRTGCTTIMSPLQLDASCSTTANKFMASAGCKVKILIADRFAMLNKKMGGDLDAIRTVGSYMVEVWKALGVNMDSVEFLWSSEEISKRPNEYLSLVMDIAMTRSVSVSRILRYDSVYLSSFSSSQS